MKKLYLSFYILFTTATCLLPLSNQAQAPCSVDEFRLLEVTYDSPCEGEGAVIDAVRYHIYTGNVSWSRVGGSLPPTSYTVQDQLYINPYYNQYAGEYRAVFTHSSSGCRDTAYIQLDSLVPVVSPEIYWVQDLCGAVRMKAVNTNDTTASHNSYAWLDQNGNYSILSQYINTNRMTETVKITNNSGCSATKFDYMPESQLKSPVYDSVITTTGGSGPVCNGSTRTYSIAAENGVNYSWTVPNGCIINSGQGTTSIHVTYNTSFSGGSVKATKSNQCGSVFRSITISKGTTPAKPSVITGTATGLCGATNKKFSVTNVVGITYNWTVPSVATIAGGQGTNQVTVNFPSSNFTGTMAVTASNSCSTSAARTLSIKAVPATPTAINGPVTVCSGSTGNTYSIASIPTATKYVWTGPSGSHITANGTTSASNTLTTTATSVTVSFGTVTSSSTIKARASNACGNGAIKSLAIKPCTPRFGQQASTLQNLLVYPNPAHETVMVTFEALEEENARIVVADLLGRKIIQSEFIATPGINQYKLPLIHLSQGTYMLLIITSEAQQAVQIVKE